VDTPEAAGAWHRSRRCSGSACVEVARLATGVAVRNSTHPEATLSFPSASWAAFLADLRAARPHAG
jgi:hypothetical protein